MSRKIESQRSYRILKEALNLFLTALQMNWSDNLTHYEAEYVFQEPDWYVVVVNEYGLHSPYNLNKMREFVDQINS